MSATPEYFQNTFGVPAEQAADLASQANIASSQRGGGLATAAPASTPQAQPVANAPTVSAQTEYDQLMADRKAGKITTATWNATGAQRERELADLIANGRGSDHAPSSQAETPSQGAVLAAEYAPASSPDDYVFPAPQGGHTDATMEADRQAKAVLLAEGLSKKATNITLQYLKDDAHSQEGKTRDQLIDIQYAGLNRMWGAEFEANLKIWSDFVQARSRSSNSYVRSWAEAAHRFNPIAVNEWVTAARFNQKR